MKLPHDGMIDPAADLPHGGCPPPLPLPHFPTRFQAVIWRNWPAITPRRLALVLQTTAPVIVDEARRMGLDDPPASEDIQQRWLSRGYITLIRQNWQLLPYPQLLQLLGWPSSRLAFALKEDDFLWAKLGRLKPQLPTVIHQPLTPEQVRATHELRQIAREAAQAVDAPQQEQAFGFVERFKAASPMPIARRDADGFDLRLIYSYHGIYGDPLLEPDADPYPDDLLARLAEQGINAIWFQALLYTLVPWLGNVAESQGHETRIRRLNQLIEKAARHGMGVYPYLNEPRGMPPAFFDHHPQWRGVHYEATGLTSLCMSCDEIPQRLEAGVRELFTRAPGLAGALTITMSENLTHCWSKPARGMPCPRCAGRPPHLVVAQVNNTIVRGILTAKPDARVIAWNWSWGEAWSRQVIDHLDPRITLMCTSETALPTSFQGVEGQVVDYSISKVGPGQHAIDHWRIARARGMKVMAKVQLNNTWECSAVPYLPVPTLVRKHLDQLKAEQVTGLMVSWTLGGYPGGNLALIDHPPMEIANALYGPAAAPVIMNAWERLGQAFECFPLHGTRTLYAAPQNYGPANPLYLQPTGYRASMLGFAHDDLDSWRAGHYPIPVFEAAFEQLSRQWGQALDELDAARPLVPPDKQGNHLELTRIARAAYCHFRSMYLQIRFIHLRDHHPRQRLRDEAPAILEEEMALALTLRALAGQDSRIGYEASNHYYYTQATLMEKALNCRWLLRQLSQGD